MRYQDTGNIHLDFHLAIDTTIKYVLREHGKGFLRELFARTAQQVYRDIYDNLKKGNMEPLLEHWDYYFKREKGTFKITRNKDRAELLIKECPAVRHLKVKGVKPEPCFCLQTVLMNEAWSDGTPFAITTEIIGEGSCRQTIRRKRHAAQ